MTNDALIDKLEAARAHNRVDDYGLERAIAIIREHTAKQPGSGVAHVAILEDMIRGALEGVGRGNCDSPIACARQVMKVIAPHLRQPGSDGVDAARIRSASDKGEWAASL